MLVELILTAIAPLLGLILFVIDTRSTIRKRKKEESNMDDMRPALEELNEVFAELGRAVATDGPIGKDTLAAFAGDECSSFIYNPDAVVATIGPATDDDKALVARTCPNCGAPVRGDDCEYCGSVFRRELPKVTVPETDEPRTVRVFDRQEGVWKWVPEENPMKAVKTSKLPTNLRWY